MKSTRTAVARRFMVAAAGATLAAATWAAPLAAVAQGTTATGPRTVRVGGFYIGAGLMEVWGDGGFTISGMDTTLGRFTSVLEFPMDATYFVLEAGIDEIGRGFGVHLRYGSSISFDGTTVDTDYAWHISRQPYIKSFSSTEGDNVFLTLDASYRLFAGRAEAGTPVQLDVFAGYHMQDATFEVSDVHSVIEMGAASDEFVSGLAATYDMEFSGLRVGVRGEIGLGTWGTISGSVAVLPFVDAEGFGQWILREKVVDHDATGWGLDLAVRYEYTVLPNLRVWGGAGYTRLEGSGGIDTQYRFSGDPIGRASLDELQSECRFVMIGGEFRF